MKTYAVSQSFSPAALSSALVETGITVITVRGFGVDETGTATSGEVVTDDAANDTTVANVIAAGTAGVITSAERAAAVAILTDPNASPKALRALGEVLLDYANRIGSQHNALLTWLGNQTTLTNRGQLSGFALPAALAKADLLSAVTAHINAGDAD